jgi:hypothetical protein
MEGVWMKVKSNLIPFVGSWNGLEELEGVHDAPLFACLRAMVGPELEASSPLRDGKGWALPLHPIYLFFFFFFFLVIRASGRALFDSGRNGEIAANSGPNAGLMGGKGWEWKEWANGRMKPTGKARAR